jgi:predicted nucleic acid-binding protein
MMVPDCSAVVYALLRQPGSEAVAKRLLSSDAELHAPHVMDLEVIQTLRRLQRAGDLDSARASSLFDDFLHLRLIRYAHVLFSSRIWELRNNISAYDAAYVALAESLNAPLLTRDKRLASAPGHRARIELV